MKSPDLSESCREAFITNTRDKGIPVTDSQVDLLLRFHEILTTSNQRFNLVSRSGRASILDQILDSLLAQSLVSRIHPQVVLDVGSGGGFPGIPLAILNPHIQFHLLEASHKRASHLVNASRLLSLQNVRTLHDRAENLSGAAPARKYDLIVARSVANLRDLVQWSRPLLKTKGILATYAGNQEARRLEGLLRSWPCPMRPLLIRSLDIGIRPEKPHRLLLIGSFG
ncbi:MAG: 16S rRNA (guanine(527)-N(7))-methyltransferase RsmG [Candidatus Handelsmanbacteria bacterium RIFCSPLOWO2_12_FULL_64_10]|uniref:Ribosomal RNA small subunit methyltransferase G n=1 Tax=Handelsmanbacteria sp. (strain RIFCSPLOWO2_12_FULL_64_10) TaxID=1817868 RepID=A0A1F6CRE1_HANXR|nr:MAG: 16S rRNA (guanine(527)-N(7))-methyltransferase RsmG [Candidatus Handelsmanbacteria bacterium RIFCSPLOWO2_12_FULL_64_10]